MAGPTSFFDMGHRAMSAQLVRMNTAASNLANAGSVAGSEAEAYRPMRTVFAEELNNATGMSSVRVGGVVHGRVVACHVLTSRPPDRGHLRSGHPLRRPDNRQPLLGRCAGWAGGAGGRPRAVRRAPRRVATTTHRHLTVPPLAGAPWGSAATVVAWFRRRNPTLRSGSTGPAPSIGPSPHATRLNPDPG